MATLKDVAKASGLTVGTVSRVLNNRGYISDKTREKVYQVMKDLNYQPNETARALSKQKSNTIGVILPNIEHPYFAKVLSRLEREAAKHGYRIMLFVSRYKEEREEQCIERCKSERVAGVILCSGSFETEKFKGLDFPLITLERSMDEGTSGIECDNYQGGQLATEHLYGKGCRILAHIGGTIEVSMPADARRQGFLDTCARYGLQGTVFNTYEAQFQAMEYQEYIVKILRENPQFDGIFASSDVIAAQVLQACSLLGIRVPQDLKLVGFDDVEVASLTTPKITTIRQPVEEIGKATAGLLFDLIKGKEKPRQLIYEGELIQRESTARCKQ